MGGGIYLSTQVYGVPKGSGLGTSSILSGACVKGIFEFLGQERTDAEIYDVVLGMEQIMSTGGGWQDQVGGLTEGIKLISTKPGIAQNLVVEKIEMPEEGKKELKERFALIYTGQRRLARNLLRDVVGGYIGSRPESLKALKEMKAIAVLMRFALEQGDIESRPVWKPMHMQPVFADCDYIDNGKVGNYPVCWMPVQPIPVSIRFFSYVKTW